MKRHETDSPRHIRDLYPDLTEAGLKEAEETIHAYITSAIRQYERISSDPTAYARLQTLTKAQRRPYPDNKGRANKQSHEKR